MLKELLVPEINELIKENNWRELKEALALWPAPDIADLISSYEGRDSFLIFRLLPRQLAADVFAELRPEKQALLLFEIGDENVINLISEMTPDDRTEFFEELPGSITKKILGMLPPAIRKESLQLLGYPDKSVGRRMTPDYVSIKQEWTVKKALSHIRKSAKKAETINIVYVTDKFSRLTDDIPLSTLIMAPVTARVSTLMDGKVISVAASSNEEEAVKIMKRYDLIVMPVVDSDNMLLGVITVDDMIDVMDTAVSQDIQKAASVVPFETLYSSANFLTLFKKRIAWLLFFALAGILSGSVISLFEETIGKVVALAFFIPALIGTGGNTAIQSSTLIIRAIALDDISPGKWLSVMKKEVLVGVLLGALLGAALFTVSFAWMRDISISVVIGSAVLFIAVWSNIIGSMLPLALTKLKLDPAVVSSPLLTTVIDVTGLLIYFAIASAVLRGM